LATLAEGRKAVACSRPLDPKSTLKQRTTQSLAQRVWVYPCTYAPGAELCSSVASVKQRTTQRVWSGPKVYPACTYSPGAWLCSSVASIKQRTTQGYGRTNCDVGAVGRLTPIGCEPNPPVPCPRGLQLIPSPHGQLPYLTSRLPW
jgi:hypothetical protein